MRLDRNPTILYALVLDIGRVFYFAERRIELEVDGIARLFDGGLSKIRFRETLGEGLSESRDMAITIVSGVDWPLVESQYGFLEAGTGYLYQTSEGATLASSRLVLKGDVRDVVVDNGVLEFSLISAAADEDTPLIDPRQVIDDVVFPTRSPGYDEWGDGGNPAYGSLYPFIIGRPGYVDYIGGSAAPVTPGSPGYVVEYSLGAAVSDHRILIAGHRVQATEVLLYDLTDAKTQGCTVYHGEDNLGQTYAYLEPENDFITEYGRKQIRVYPEHEYWIAWGEDDGGIGYRNTLLRGAADVIEYLLRQTRLEVDYSSLAANRAFLNRFLLDGFVNNDVSIMSFLDTEILPLLPITLHQTAKGWSTIVWRFDAKPQDAIATLTEGLNFWRDSGISKSHDASKVYNKLTLKYAMRGDTETFLRRTQIDGDYDSSDPLKVVGALNKRSQTEFGVREKVVSSRFVNDTFTAGLILRWLSWRTCLPRRIISGSVSRQMSWLPLGAVVQVNEPDIYWDNVLCLVTGISTSEGTTSIVLEEIPNPTLRKKEV